MVVDDFPTEQTALEPVALIPTSPTPVPQPAAVEPELPPVTTARVELATAGRPADVVDARRPAPTDGGVARDDVRTEQPRGVNAPAQPAQQFAAVPATPLEPVASVPMSPMPPAQEGAVKAGPPPLPPPVTTVRAEPTARSSDAAGPRRPAQAQDPAAADRADTRIIGATPGPKLDHMRIRLDGASKRTTEQDTEIISGTLVGGASAHMVVDVEGRENEPVLNGRLFTTTVKLSPGPNRVRLLATDALGAQVEETVTVQYVPPLTEDVTLTNPHDGDRLTRDDPPLVAVEGQVRDTSLTTVWLVANQRRIQVPVHAGRFRHVVPVLEREVRIRAEIGTERRGTPTITVHADAAVPALAFGLLNWPRDTAGPPRLSVSWRPNPATLDGIRALQLRDVPGSGEAGVEFGYLRDARPGVYTFSIAYRVGPPAQILPVLSVAGAPRALPAMTVDGSGRAVIVRLLLPQGVLWEQEDWFTGRSVNGDIVTKFRFPDGVSWSERAGDVVR